MLSFLFPYTEALRVGEYLMGSPKWSDAVSLRNARIMCVAGVGASCLGPTVLQLEVDGELIDKTIPVLPLRPGERINSVVALNRVLSPGSELRIKCVRAPGLEEDCIREVGVNLEATMGCSPTGLVGTESQELFVMWVNGQEEIRLFEYAPETKQFTESVPGRAAGRASILNGPDCEIRIQGELALQIGSDRGLHCGGLTATGGTSSFENPRLEFWRGGKGQIPPQRLASLTKSGRLVMVDFSEVAASSASASVAEGKDRFTFLGAGAPAAVIGPVKCSALGLKEGWIVTVDRVTSDGLVRVTNDGARRVVVW